MANASGGELPYKLVAGTLPCAGGWLLVSAKLKGATFAPDFPRVHDVLYDVVHRRPPFAICAMNAPIGAPDEALVGKRSCDVEASGLLGVDLTVARWREAAPYLAGHESDESAASEEATLWRTRVNEVVETMAPYLQRTTCEVVPELCFYQLNGEHPLAHPSDTPEGYDERRALLVRVPGITRILDANEPGVTRLQLLEASAMLWSARRITARAGVRLPKSPEWDDRGMRIEILR